MLYQLSYSRPNYGGEGRIRTSEGLRPADLQSAAFDRFATSPLEKTPNRLSGWDLLRGRGLLEPPGAGEGI